MNLTETQQTELRSLAGVYLPLPKIARIMEVNENELIQAYFILDSEVRRLVDAGRLETEAKIQQTTFQLAINGSVPALTAAQKMMETTLRQEKKLPEKRFLLTEQMALD